MYMSSNCLKRWRRPTITSNIRTRASEEVSRCVVAAASVVNTSSKDQHFISSSSANSLNCCDCSSKDKKKVVNRGALKRKRSKDRSVIMIFAVIIIEVWEVLS